MKIFVAGSIEKNIDDRYLKEAKKYSDFLASNEHDLIFGATKDGILRVVYESFKEQYRYIKAVTIERYKEDLKKITADEEIVSANEHKQFKRFCEADMMVIMPGGYGTLSELFYIINAKRNNEIRCPIYLINMFGYYDETIKMIKKVCKENFSNKTNLIIEIKELEDLEEKMSEC